MTIFSPSNVIPVTFSSEIPSLFAPVSRPLPTNHRPRMAACLANKDAPVNIMSMAGSSIPVTSMSRPFLSSPPTRGQLSATSCPAFPSCLRSVSSRNTAIQWPTLTGQRVSVDWSVTVRGSRHECQGLQKVLGFRESQGSREVGSWSSFDVSA